MKFFKQLKAATIVLTVSFIFSFALMSFANENVTITILGTSDIHGKLFNYSYESGEADESGGLVKLATIVKQIRKEMPHVILIDNGDVIQGTPLTDDLYNTIWINEPHPMIKAMNLMGYDSMTLGNHEFNFGLDLIKKIEAEADFPILGANIFNKDDMSYFVKPWTIIERAKIKIGIIGAVIPTIPVWDGPRVTSLTFAPLAQEIKKAYTTLTEKYKVDLVIATAHSGLDGNEIDKGTAARHICEEIPELAALIIGHDHKTIVEKINNVQVTGTKDSAQEIGRIDLELSQIDGKWIIVKSEGSIISAKNYEADSSLSDALMTEHKKTIDFINTAAAKATDDFLPDYIIRHENVPVALLKDTAMMDLIQKVQLFYVPDAQISATALLFPDSNLSKGEISYKNIFDIYRYPNTLVGVKVTGKELKNYIESSARFYNTFTPGDVIVSFSPGIRAYNYDMFQGVEYELDISEPTGKRLKNLKYNGNLVKDTDEFNLAINNYRYSVLKSSGKISNEAYFTSDPKTIRSYIFDYVANHKEIAPEVDNNWLLTGVENKHWAHKAAINLINNKIISIAVANRVYNIEPINLEDKITWQQFLDTLSKITDTVLPNTDTPNDFITKAQAIAVINSLIDENSLNKEIDLLTAFKDYSQIDTVIQPLYQHLLSKEYLKSEDSTMLNHSQPLTRGEKASLLNALFTKQLSTH